MACACGSNKKSSTQNWLHKKPNGTTQTHSSEMDAQLAAAREGGTVRRA